MIFPAINSLGVRAHYPNGVTFEHLTNSTTTQSGMRYANSWRNNPLLRYDLSFASLTDAEALVLQNFFDSCYGRYKEFKYVDPTGNLLQYSEDFTQSYWTKTCTIGFALTDPFGGTAGFTLTGDGSGNSSLSQDVLLTPEVSGSVACFSVYLQGVDTELNTTIRVTDGTSTVSKSVKLEFGVWKRFFVQWKFGSTGFATVSIGGNSTWTGANSIGVFGPMFSLTKGDAPYARTPLFYALHNHCRFDKDSLPINRIGPNQNNADIKIIEFRPPGGACATCLDVSPSLSSADIDYGKSALLEFMNDIDVSWSMAVWTMSAAVTLINDFTKNRTTLTSAINGISNTPVSGTSVYDAIYTMALRNPTAILMISDMDDTWSTHTQAQAIAMCNCPVFVVGLGTSFQVSVANAFATATGGAYIFSPTTAELYKFTRLLTNLL